MDKEIIREFIKWLDVAGIEDITKRQKEIRELLQLTTTPEGRSDLRFVLRLIDKELITRSDLSSSKESM